MKYQFSNARLLLSVSDKGALADDVGGEAAFAGRSNSPARVGWFCRIGGEAVFAGRSNAGKSSVIDKLRMRKNPAKKGKP